MPWAVIVQEIMGIAATLLSIFSKSYEAHQNPAMVLNAVQKFHQDLQDKQREIDALAADPHATAADHQKALEAIRLSQS